MSGEIIARDSILYVYLYALCCAVAMQRTLQNLIIVDYRWRDFINKIQVLVINRYIFSIQKDDIAEARNEYQIQVCQDVEMEILMHYIRSKCSEKKIVLVTVKCWSKNNHKNQKKIYTTVKSACNKTNWCYTLWHALTPRNKLEWNQ